MIKLNYCSTEFDLHIKNEHAKTFYDYTNKKLAKESRRSYSFGWKKFQTWISENGYTLKPIANEIAFLAGSFLSDMAKTGTLKYRSLVSYHAAIKTYVRDLYQIDLDHIEIRNAMKGIRNELKQTPMKKDSIKAENIKSMVCHLSGSEKLIDIRDRSLLLLGFSGAFRRSELAGIDLEHITFEDRGISIHIPFSKTDQDGRGQHVEIPYKYGSSNCCISSLKEWLRLSGISSGPLFRSITRHGSISQNRLNGKSIALIIKKRCKGFFEDTKNISGHSLRRGFVMSSLESDVPLVSIMNQTRHSSVNTLKEYSSDKKNYKTSALNYIDI